MSKFVGAFLAAASVAAMAGCGSSSVAHVIPPIAPLVSSTPSSEATFAGILTKVKLGPTHPTKWQIRNPTQAVGLPVDVSKVASAAQTLAGQRVLISGKWIAGPNNATVLSADQITPWTDQVVTQ